MSDAEARLQEWADEKASRALDEMIAAAIAAAEKRGYARAREQAQAIAEASRIEANAFIAAGCTLQEVEELEREAAAAEEIRDEIRAMKDETP